MSFGNRNRVVAALRATLVVGLRLVEFAIRRLADRMEPEETL